MAHERGPFRPSQVKDGDRYEISHGHPVHVAPAGRRHGRSHLVGTLPIATDPAVREAGLDVGYETSEDTLRAPDIAVGNVPDGPGWAKGAPALAIEYADRGTDEDDLQLKIRQLFEAGTQHLWVVRLVGPRRVDVHRPGAQPFTVPGGGELTAEGVLSRPVAVDALFDLERASEVALDNLLRRHGYGTVEDIRAEAIGALRRAVEGMCEVLGIALDETRRARIAEAKLEGLDAMLAHLREHRRFPE